MWEKCSIVNDCILQQIAFKSCLHLVCWPACLVKLPSSPMEWLIALIVINDLARRSRKLQNHVRAQSPSTVIVAKVITEITLDAAATCSVINYGATSYPARLNNDFLYQRLSPLDDFLLRYYSILLDIIPFGKEPWRKLNNSLAKLSNL